MDNNNQENRGRSAVVSAVRPLSVPECFPTTRKEGIGEGGGGGGGEHGREEWSGCRLV